MPNATLLLSCPDAKGIVASVARFVFDHGGNIVHADQHTDAGEGWFVQRVEWQLDDFDLERSAIRLAFADIARHFDMRWSLHFSDDVRRTALFVSQREHCLYDLVVLARYMQVFSAAFAGARPYHQAHEKGVKVIGATAHYVTAELDAGPIIEQDVARVSHRDDVADLVRKGRDLERMVLARALNYHLENRVVVYGGKTVVFD